jgi:hypothetical protein
MQMELSILPHKPIHLLSRLSQVLITFTLFTLSNAVIATCVQSGDITGSNGATVLGSAGCGDAPGNKKGTVFPLASIV